MNSPASIRSNDRVSQGRAPRGWAWLSLVWYVLLMLVASGIGNSLLQLTYGERGVAMGTLSWLLVVTGGLLPLALMVLFAHKASLSQFLMLGLLPRMFVPLAGTLALRSYADWSVTGGPVALLGYYLVALLAETWLTVRYFTFDPAAPNSVATLSSPQA